MAGTARRSGQPALKPGDFHVLLALSRQDSHGYGLVVDIEEQSGGRVKLVPGSLYAILRRLREWGWVEEVAGESAASAGPPRRLFRLTGQGSRVLAAEVARMRELVAQFDAPGEALAERPTGGGAL